MAKFLYKTGDGTGPNGKPRVYFTCHPGDADCLERLCSDIFRTHNCAVFYTEDMSEPLEPAKREVDLGRHNLFVVPVTEKLLNQPNRAMDVDIPFALAQHIPILPIMLEPGLEDDYSAPEKFGNLQFLSLCDGDATAIAYLDKLKKFLDSTLIGKELFARIRSAFDARIFLSYRKKDRHFANELMRMIHADYRFWDVAIWFDEFLTPGENFFENIQQALSSCELFTLLVTPNLLEEPGGKPNFVMAEEYPAAQNARKPILPVEMAKTDRASLERKYRQIPQCVSPEDRDAFHARLALGLAGLAKKPKLSSPQRNYLIGLAYLEGIDVEVDREKAVQLITVAAEANLPEAIVRLICMYTDGHGVARDPELAAVLSQRLCDYYYSYIFTPEGTLGNKRMLKELFSHYEEPHWEQTILLFLQKADACAESMAIRELVTLLEEYGIHEYTLLFKACCGMKRNQDAIRLQLVVRLLRSSIDGTYPPYGHFFWYIPEFELYETAVLAAEVLYANPKALALVRDVCFIFGQYDHIRQVTDRVDGELLFQLALPGLPGVRRALCQRFFTDEDPEVMAVDIYPRCFNPREARALARTGVGREGQLTRLFKDELGLFEVTQPGAPIIGLVTLPYDDKVELTLAGNSPYLRGLILLDTDNIFLDYLEFYRRNLKVFYIPENCTRFSKDYALHMDLDLFVQMNVSEKQEHYGPFIRDFTAKTHRYVRRNIRIPKRATGLQPGQFMQFTALQSVQLPEEFANPNSWSFDAFYLDLYDDLPDEDPDASEYDDEDDHYAGADIGARCFENCVNLRRIKLSANVCDIGDRAFYNCRNLQRISFPDEIRSIGKQAFSGCGELELLEFGFCSDIDDYAFEKCENLQWINFREGFNRIGFHAFSGCKNLHNVTFAQPMRMIMDYAFSGTALRCVKFPSQASCILESAYEPEFEEIFRFKLSTGTFSQCKLLETLILPDDLKVIPVYCFGNCSRLSRVHLPQQLEQIQAEAFLNCGELQVVAFPGGLQTIGSAAFKGCDLTSLMLPESVRQIGSAAFADNKNLKQISILNPGVIVEEGAFAGCDGLTHATLPETLRNRDLGLPQGCSITWIGESTAPASSDKTLHIRWLRKIPAAAYRQNTHLAQVSIEDAEAIEDHAFSGCISLETVQVPACLTQIGHWAFAGCRSLQSIPFLPQIQALGGGAFEDCSALTEAVLHEEMTSLDGWAFCGCTRLETVKFPPRLQRIYTGAFLECHSLRLDETLEHVTEVWDKAFADCTHLQRLRLPKVQQILDQAFFGCEKLTALEVGPDLEVLGTGVFSRCKMLSTIDLSHTNLRQLPESAFAECEKLERISLPPGLEFIYWNAFCGCTALKSVQIPDSVYRIGYVAFANCTSLEQISLKNITVIEDCLFAHCNNLKTVELSAQLREIRGAAFYGCAALRQISLGERLVAIGKEAFRDCTALETLRIPSSVTEIGDDAFAGCTALESVWISRNFQEEIHRIFGQIDKRIIHYYGTEDRSHTAQQQKPEVKPEPKKVTYEDLRERSAQELAAQIKTEDLNAAVELLLSVGQASVAVLQRRLVWGYARSTRVIERLEELGIVGPFVPGAPRAVLLTRQQWEAMGQTVPPQS